MKRLSSHSMPFSVLYPRIFVFAGTNDKYIYAGEINRTVEAEYFRSLATIKTEAGEARHKMSYSFI